jgi:hypothetical protein
MATVATRAFARRGIVLAAIVGCQGALVGEDYRGVPIFSTRLPVQVGAESERGSRYRVGLFFTTRMESDDPETWSELVGSSVEVEIPSEILFSVYSAPLKSQFLARGLAMGRILLYRDANGSGRREAGEDFVAITPASLFAYVDKEYVADGRILSGNLTEGFHVVNLPQRCGVNLPAPTDPETCGVPVGDNCRTDMDCKGGLCLKETKFPWPGGYCVVPAFEPGRPGACIPAKANFLGAPTFSVTPPGVRGFYARSCATDTDCLRRAGREQLYTCDQSLAICMPPTGLLTPVGGRFEVEPICTKM